MRRALITALLAALLAVPIASGQIAPTPEPVLGERLVLERVSGVVRFRADGEWRELTGSLEAPFPAAVDATRGVVRVTTTTGEAQFSKGQFVARQAKSTGALTDLRLAGGNFGRCTGGEARASARRVSIRKLFGKGKGKFRTTGRFSAATVRGTEWLTDDSCVGTLTAVSSGVVEVRDFITRRTTKVRRGHTYRATRGPGAGLD